MTPESQCVAIAEACGWTFVCSHLSGEEPDFRERKEKATHCWVRPGNMLHEWERIPDFLADLNAMHEAEEKLSGTQLTDYLCRLGQVTGGDRKPRGWQRRWATCHATAAQRAEAFLRALNLWTE